MAITPFVSPSGGAGWGSPTGTILPTSPTPAPAPYSPYPTYNFSGSSVGGYAQPGVPQSFDYTTNPVTFKGGNLGNIEASAGMSSQIPVNVLNVLPQLSGALGGYQDLANQAIQNRPDLALGFGYAGPQTFQSQLSQGIDPFGQRGISEGLQNIGLQREAANRALQTSLGRTGDNQNLINVLQNQNLFRSQLGLTPLMAEAQKGTAERISQQIQMQNLQQQLLNQTALQQGSFNQQAGLAGMQPYQNYLDALMGLAGFQRGTVAGESQIGARNYKA